MSTDARTEVTIDVWCEGRPTRDGGSTHQGRRAWVTRLIRTMDFSEPDWPPLWWAVPHSRSAATQRAVREATGADLPPSGEPIAVAPDGHGALWEALSNDTAPVVVEYVHEDDTVSSLLRDFAPEYRGGRWHGSRAKFLLRCPSCPLDVQLTGVKVGPRLDTAVAHGVSELPLYVLSGNF